MSFTLGNSVGSYITKLYEQGPGVLWDRAVLQQLVCRLRYVRVKAEKWSV